MKSEKKVYRSREQSILIGLIAVGVMVWIVLAALLTPRLDLWERGLACLAGLSAGSFLLFRVARAGVYVRAGGITVLNPFRTRMFSWQQVHGFSLGRWGLFPKIGFVDLEDGSRLHICDRSKCSMVPSRPVRLGRILAWTWFRLSWK
jgi:hypothetical protein